MEIHKPYWISEHFDIREFVDPDTWNQFGENSRWFIDKRLVDCVELLRELTGSPIIINDWHVGGRFKESGLRNPITSTGARYSQHKFGRAADCKLNGNTEDVRNIIRKNWDKFKSLGLTTIEKDTPTWVHLDCRYTGLDTLFEVPYK